MVGLSYNLMDFYDYKYNGEKSCYLILSCKDKKEREITIIIGGNGKGLYTFNSDTLEFNLVKGSENYILPKDEKQIRKQLRQKWERVYKL